MPVHLTRQIARSVPEFGDTLNCTCDSVSARVSKHHLSSENAAMAIYAQIFFLALA